MSEDLRRVLEPKAKTTRQVSELIKHEYDEDEMGREYESFIDYGNGKWVSVDDAVSLLKDYALVPHKQLSEKAFCLRNFDDEEIKSKCKHECIFGEKPFELSLCQHSANQDLVFRLPNLKGLFEEKNVEEKGAFKP